MIGVSRWLHDESLPVLPELPPGVEEMPAHVREAWGRTDGELRHFHFCPRCCGWVDGQPSLTHDDALGPRPGRRGTAYYCRRCGGEIAFLPTVR